MSSERGNRRRRNRPRKRGLGFRKRRTAQRKLLLRSGTSYGNIDVRKELPDGLSYVDVARIQPLARKLGIPQVKALTGFDEYRSGQWAAIHSGIVVAECDEEALLNALAERDARNTEEVRRKREQARERAEAKKKVKFAESIRLRFPGMPNDLEDEIAAHATVKGSGRVGRSRTAEDPVWLAVNAYVRWNFTDYEILLDEAHERFRNMPRDEKKLMRDLGITPKDEAIRPVDKLVHDILDFWEGKDIGKKRLARVMETLKTNELLRGVDVNCD